MARGKKLDAKQFALQKRKRRQWLTFVRMVRYGINNFSRNAWLTIAATAVMTITLLIIFTTLAARNTLISTVDEIKSKVDMSIYLKADTKSSDANKIVGEIKNLPNVERVNYLTPAQVRADFAKQKNSDPATLEALNQAINRFPGIVRINLKDVNDVSSLDNYVKTSATYKEHAEPSRPASFAGERRTAIQRIGQWVSFADKAGLVASAVFIVISSLIVFNTIRMAIFNRKEEIQMMKLIGADRSFIRGPFVVEAVVYGFIAAIFATGIGIGGLYATKDKLMAYQIAIAPTLDFILQYIGFVVLGMIVVGAAIGIISSLFATQRYLKI